MPLQAKAAVLLLTLNIAQRMERCRSISPYLSERKYGISRITASMINPMTPIIASPPFPAQVRISRWMQ